MSTYKTTTPRDKYTVKADNKNDARKLVLERENIQLEKIVLPTGKKRYHLFAHMDRNYVKKGDNVIKHVTPIGTVGNGNGQYYAHLHFSISEGLTVDELYKYIAGWSEEKVEKFYKNPKDIDFDKMFGRKVDVGNFGYDYLDWVGYGYHTGVDVNGLSGGNTDFGYAFKASCDGEVIYEKRTWLKNGGWGNLIVIEEK